MKGIRIVFFFAIASALSVNYCFGQNNQAADQKFTFANAVDFLQLHTGLASETFDEKTFKFHTNTTINGIKVSGMYVSTKPDADKKMYEFFIRTDNMENAGPYKIYNVAGCQTQRLEGLSAFNITNNECICKVSGSKNFVLKARDVKSIF